MHATPPSNSPSPPPSAGTTIRANACLDETAQPPLTSGFGAVMEQERDIQSSTQQYLGADRGSRSTPVNRVLGLQEARLGANIALLEERYEMLPNPGRFHTLRETGLRAAARHEASTHRDVRTMLSSLIAQHRDLLRKIDALITQRPDGQRGELILGQVARNHEEMAWTLTALINSEDMVRDLVPIPIIARAPATAQPPSEARWENEGGATAGPPGV